MHLTPKTVHDIYVNDFIKFHHDVFRVSHGKILWYFKKVSLLLSIKHHDCE